MKQFKNIMRFLAVVIVAFALIVTCAACFNFAAAAHSAFRALCSVVTLIAGGYAVYKASRRSLEPFTRDQQ